MLFGLEDGVFSKITHTEKLEYIGKQYRHWLDMTGLKHTPVRRDAFAAGLQCRDSLSSELLRSKRYRSLDEGPYCVYCHQPVKGVVVVHPQCAEAHEHRCSNCGDVVEEFADGTWCQDCVWEFSE